MTEEKAGLAEMRQEQGVVGEGAAAFGLPRATPPWLRLDSSLTLRLEAVLASGPIRRRERAGALMAHRPASHALPLCAPCLSGVH